MGYPQVTAPSRTNYRAAGPPPHELRPLSLSLGRGRVICRRPPKHYERQTAPGAQQDRLAAGGTRSRSQRINHIETGKERQRAEIQERPARTQRPDAPENFVHVELRDQMRQCGSAGKLLVMKGARRGGARPVAGAWEGLATNEGGARGVAAALSVPQLPASPRLVRGLDAPRARVNCLGPIRAHTSRSAAPGAPFWKFLKRMRFLGEPRPRDMAPFKLPAAGHIALFFGRGCPAPRDPAPPLFCFFKFN
jgi:hypothetical protein